MLKEPFVSIVKTAASALRSTADLIEIAKNAGEISTAAGLVDGIAFRLMTLSGEAKNASYKG